MIALRTIGSLILLVIGSALASKAWDADSLVDTLLPALISSWAFWTALRLLEIL